jgi:benzaldehyde dehydrogenase (NAD)
VSSSEQTYSADQAYSSKSNDRARLFESGDYRGMLVSGRGFRPSQDGTVEVLEKATGAVLHLAGVAAENEVSEAVRCAAQAQPAWSSAPGPTRSDVLRRFAALIEVHQNEIKEWIIRETGSVMGKAVFEVEMSIRESIEASTLATKPVGEIVTREGGLESTYMRVPMGVVGVITPWNSPLILAVRSVAPALALGNSVVLKPDLQTPVSGGFLIARLLEEAGLPPGLLQVIPGGAVAGEALVSHADVAMITFTGSTATGRRVGEVAGRWLKRASLELGGNNAYIVCDDADLERATMAGAFGAFFHQGQICFTIGSHLVHQKIYREYVRRLTERTKNLGVGDPFRSDVHLGPIINEKQAARAQALLDESVKMGAKILIGGKREGLFFQPTVVEVRPDMPLFREEIFGPIAPVLSVEDDREAVRLANSTGYGLAAAIQTGSMYRGQAIAQQLKTGVVHINDQPVIHSVYGPIGGMGASGNGGRTGLPAWEHEFTQLRWQTMNETSPEYPF